MVAIVFGFLRLVGGMPTRSAGGVAVIVALLWDAVTPRKFKPFGLAIIPKWFDLIESVARLDATDPAATRDVLATIRSFNPTVKELVDQGLRLTFLKHDLMFVRPGLVFKSRLDFRGRCFTT